MHALVLMVALAAHPNVFEPKEPSSEDIFAAVAVCMDKAITAGASEVSAIATCGCLMDAKRANERKRATSPEPTPEQLTRCHVLASERTAPPKPGKTGT